MTSNSGSSSSTTITKENYETLTLFECLGVATVEELATTPGAELQRRFRRRSLLFHPDKDSSPEAREVFEKLKLAAETLCDDTLRRDYLYSLEKSESEAKARKLAEASVSVATDALRERERAFQVAVRTRRELEAKRKHASAALVRDLTAATTSFREMEDQLLREWDIDEELLCNKELEVRKLLARMQDTSGRKRVRVPLTTGGNA